MEKPRILVVDDDAWILRMVTTVLEKRGYEVDTACDGEEAYEKVFLSKPNLLITDVMMPNMDGWALVKALRGHAEFAFVPVIFLTALSSDDDRIRGFRLGADDYLPKPFRFEELDLRVGKTMSRIQQLEKAARLQLEDRLPRSQTLSDENADLTGNLCEVGISSLLVLLDMEKKSGVLIVMQETVDENAEDVVARITLSHGRPVAAEIVGRPELRNEMAIYHVLEWAAGSFAFESGHIDCDAEMHVTTTSLLMEGARRIDESHR